MIRVWWKNWRMPSVDFLMSCQILNLTFYGGRIISCTRSYAGVQSKMMMSVMLNLCKFSILFYLLLKQCTLQQNILSNSKKYFEWIIYLYSHCWSLSEDYWYVFSIVLSVSWFLYSLLCGWLFGSFVVFCAQHIELASTWGKCALQSFKC